MKPIVQTPAQILMRAWVACLICVWATVALAAGTVTIHVNAGLGMPRLLNSAGDPLSDGTEVRLGLIPEGSVLTTDLNDLTSLKEQWEPLGALSVSSIRGSGGHLVGSVDFTNIPEFTGPVYWWILETSADDAPDAELSNIVSHGLFSSNLPHWSVPTPDSVIPSTLISSAEIDVTLVGMLDRDLHTHAVPLLVVPVLTLVLGAKPNAISVQWQAREGENYRLEFSDSLQPDSWELLTVLNGAAMEMVYEDERHPSTVGFYRLTVVAQ